MTKVQIGNDLMQLRPESFVIIFCNKLKERGSFIYMVPSEIMMSKTNFET